MKPDTEHSDWSDEENIFFFALCSIFGTKLCSFWIMNRSLCSPQKERISKLEIWHLVELNLRWCLDLDDKPKCGTSLIRCSFSLAADRKLIFKVGKYSKCCKLLFPTIWQVSPYWYLSYWHTNNLQMIVTEGEKSIFRRAGHQRDIRGFLRMILSTYTNTGAH